ARHLPGAFVGGDPGELDQASIERAGREVEPAGCRRVLEDPEHFTLELRGIGRAEALGLPAENAAYPFRMHVAQPFTGDEAGQQPGSKSRGGRDGDAEGAFVVASAPEARTIAWQETSRRH